MTLAPATAAPEGSDTSPEIAARNSCATIGKATPSVMRKTRQRKAPKVMQNFRIFWPRRHRLVGRTPTSAADVLVGLVGPCTGFAQRDQTVLPNKDFLKALNSLKLLFWHSMHSSLLSLLLLAAAAQAQTIVQSFDGDKGPGLAACEAGHGHCDRPEMDVGVNGKQVVQ